MKNHVGLYLWCVGPYSQPKWFFSIVEVDVMQDSSLTTSWHDTFAVSWYLYFWSRINYSRSIRPTFTIYRHVIFCIILFYELNWGYEVQKEERNQYSAVKTFCGKKKRDDRWHCLHWVVSSSRFRWGNFCTIFLQRQTIMWWCRWKVSKSNEESCRVISLMCGSL